MPTDSITTVATHDGRRYPIEGELDFRFAPVVEAFLANFAAGKEIGCSVAFYLDGERVVDLWGGFQDAARTRPWKRDTIVNMMSVSKAIMGMCVHMCADRGLLDVTRPVADYWPEFAAAGKAELPVRFILDHRAGLPYLKDRLPRGSAYDARLMADALARQAPLIPPGTDPQYHVLTQGYLMGELVRRVSGKTAGQFLREEVSAPLGLDYQIGLNEAELARCADFVLAPDNGLLRALKAPDTPEGVFWAELDESEDFNSRRWRMAEIPSANGHGNARSVARLYACMANGGELDGVRLMSAAGVTRMTTEQHHLPETLVGRHYHQASGVILNSPPVSHMGPSPRAFGHQGAGGPHGFGDPDHKVGFAYAMNKFQTEPGIPTRNRLIDAFYGCL